MTIVILIVLTLEKTEKQRVKNSKDNFLTNVRCYFSLFTVNDCPCLFIFNVTDFRNLIIPVDRFKK